MLIRYNKNKNVIVKLCTPSRYDYYEILIWRRFFMSNSANGNQRITWLSAKRP